MDAETELTEIADKESLDDQAFWDALWAARKERPAREVREAIGRRRVRCGLVFPLRGRIFLLPIAKDRARWLISGLPGYAEVWAAEVWAAEEGDGVYLFTDGVK